MSVYSVWFFCSSRRRHTRCALVTGVQTCALPIYCRDGIGLPVRRARHHADYIASWLGVLREDNRAIFRAASAATKAADWLLARHREAQAARQDGRIAA